MPPAGVDTSVYTALGRLSAQVEALQAAMVLERTELRDHLDHLEEQISTLHDKMGPMEHEQRAMTEAQESMRKKLGALTTVSAKTTWIIGTVTTIGSGIFIGLVWMIVHWTDLMTVIGKIFSPQGQGK